jgi:hypothetical protein
LSYIRINSALRTIPARPKSLLIGPTIPVLELKSHTGGKSKKILLGPRLGILGVDLFF